MGRYSIGDILAIIAAMLQHPDERLQEHARSLQGPRTRGSRTTKGLDALPVDLEFLDHTETVQLECRQPGCVYLQMDALQLGGRLGAIAYKDAKARGYEVCRRTAGTHGDELYVDQPQEAADLPPCEQITVVLGPVGEYPGIPRAVYTWHPGDPLAFLQSDQAPTDLTAVKLYR